MNKILLVAILGFTIFNVFGISKTSKPVISEDWDYSLPSWVVPAANSSINTIDDTFKMPNTNMAQRIIISWADVEPTEGVYEFEKIKKRILDVVKEKDLHGIELSIRGAVSKIEWTNAGKLNPGTAPKWLIDKYNLQEMSDKESDLGFKVYNVPIWNENYHRHYLKFIEELGKSGIPQMKEVNGCYVHAISGSRGEEANFKLFDWCISNMGLTPELYLSVMKERLKATADAFKGMEWKLMWVGSGTENSKYPTVAEDIINYAYDLGMGQRCGFVEVYLLHLENRFIGQYIDNEGYLCVDENCPPIKYKRNFGDENEEYTPQHVARFGDVKYNPSRYRESMLRTLQMRRNTLWLSKWSYQVSPELSEYVSLELGRDVYDAPDAWVYLRETYLKPVKEGELRPVKNFERWMSQRDKEGYKTVACEPVPFDGYHMRSSLPDSNYRFNNTARRTDIASGNKKIGFAIDDRFLENYNGQLQLKITYVDRGTDSWKLNFKNKKQKWQSVPVKCNDTGKILTATININNPVFDAKEMNYDFEIEAGKQDAVISFVRIIKLDKN